MSGCSWAQEECGGRSPACPRTRSTGGRRSGWGLRRFHNWRGGREGGRERKEGGREGEKGGKEGGREEVRVHD